MDDSRDSRELGRRLRQRGKRGRARKTGGLVLTRFEGEQVVLQVNGEFVVLTFDLTNFHDVPQIRVHLAGNRDVVALRPEVMGEEELESLRAAGFQVAVAEKEVTSCDSQGQWVKKLKRTTRITRPAA